MDRKHRPVNALQQLIADYLADHPGESYTSIANRGELPKQTVQSLATKATPRQTPRPDTISRLARGLQTSESVVRHAAGEAAGFGIEGLQAGDETLLIAEFRDLDEQSRADLQRRLRYLAAEARERRRSQSGE